MARVIFIPEPCLQALPHVPQQRDRNWPSWQSFNCLTFSQYLVVSLHSAGEAGGRRGQKGEVKQRLMGAAAAEQPRPLARCPRALPCPWFWSSFAIPFPTSLLQLSGGSMGPISGPPLLLMATSTQNGNLKPPPLGITSPPCLLFSPWAFGILVRDGSQKDRILFFARERTSRDQAEGLYSQVLGPQFPCSAFFSYPGLLFFSSVDLPDTTVLKHWHSLYLVNFLTPCPAHWYFLNTATI